MNVLMIATEKLPVPPVRGGAIHLYHRGCANPRPSPPLTILGRTDPALPKRNTEGNITYERVESDGSFKTYKKSVTAFLKGRSYDLIHIFNRPRLVLPVAEAIPGARIILSMHNDMFIPRKIAPDEGAKVIEQVERIITVSNYVGHAIQAMYPQAAGNCVPFIQGLIWRGFLLPPPGSAGDPGDITEKTPVAREEGHPLCRPPLTEERRGHSHRGRADPGEKGLQDRAGAGGE